MRCSREEVVRETWNQLKRSLNDAGDEVLRDEDLHSWFLSANIENDPARPGWLRNSEPLLVNHVDTWALRPEATTAIPNLFLASDYVRTHTDLATMEAANEAARRAVNGLLDAVKFDGSRCELWPLHEPEILLPWRLHDAARYQAGLPWDASLAQVAAHALRGGSPLLEQARPLLELVSPFTHAVADTLDPRADDVSVLDVVDPTTMGRRLVDVPTLQDVLIKVADTVPAAGEIVGPAGFLDRLVWYRDMIADMLAGGVPTWEPQRHLYGLVRNFIDRSGKGLRPALCIATARALGGRAEDALPPPPGWKCCTMPFSCTTILKTVAIGGVALRQCIAAPGCQLP